MPKAPKQTQIGVRVDDELLERIDAACVKLRTMWHEPTRSDIVRACVVAGLPAVEAQAAKVARATAGGELELEKPKPRK